MSKFFFKVFYNNILYVDCLLLQVKNQPRVILQIFAFFVRFYVCIWIYVCIIIDIFICLHFCLFVSFFICQVLRSNGTLVLFILKMYFFFFQTNSFNHKDRHRHKKKKKKHGNKVNNMKQLRCSKYLQENVQEGVFVRLRPSLQGN